MIWPIVSCSVNRPRDDGAMVVCGETGDETGTMNVSESGESDGTAGFKSSGAIEFAPFGTVDGTTGRTASASPAVGAAIARSNVGWSGFGNRSASNSLI